MSTDSKISLAEYEARVQRGDFDGLNHRRVELIYGEIRDMSPAGDVHDAMIELVSLWSAQHVPEGVRTRSQCGLEMPAQDSIPEPDFIWIRPGTSIRRKAQTRRYAAGHRNLRQQPGIRSGREERTVRRWPRPGILGRRHPQPSGACLSQSVPRSISADIHRIANRHDCPGILSRSLAEHRRTLRRDIRLGFVGKVSRVVATVAKTVDELQKAGACLVLAHALGERGYFSDKA